MEKEKLYSHAFDFTFEVQNSNEEQGQKETGETLRKWLIDTIEKMSDDEIREACLCFDTMCNE